MKYIYLQLISISLFIALWELISHSNIVNIVLFPPPSQIIFSLFKWMSTGTFVIDVLSSLYRVLLGFIIGGLIGCVVGLITGRYRLISNLISPIIQLVRPIPPVAIIPLIIVWFGIGEIAKITSISLAVFFPVWINTHIASNKLPIAYLHSAYLLNKSKLDAFVRVIVPGSLSGMISGLRTAIAIAFIMCYVCELAGASEGIGYQISISHLAYDIKKMMAALIVLGGLGYFFDYVFQLIITYCFPWLRLNTIN